MKTAGFGYRKRHGPSPIQRGWGEVPARLRRSASVGSVWSRLVAHGTGRFETSRPSFWTIIGLCKSGQGFIVNTKTQDIDSRAFGERALGFVSRPHERRGLFAGRAGEISGCAGRVKSWLDRAADSAGVIQSRWSGIARLACCKSRCGGVREMRNMLADNGFRRTSDPCGIFRHHSCSGWRFHVIGRERTENLATNFGWKVFETGV